MILPVNPINEYAVALCARSAHRRPVRTTRSKLVSLPARAAEAAARSRAIFCWGVSPGIAPWPSFWIVLCDVLLCAVGMVAVNRVASEAERAIF